MALEGTIKDFGLPDIFQLIGLQRKTGLLTLKNEKENVTVTFENGMVVMADSNTKRLAASLQQLVESQGTSSPSPLPPSPPSPVLPPSGPSPPTGPAPSFAR